MNKRLLATALSLSLAFCGAAQAADLRLLNADPAGSGLNDPTPATPVGGNPGNTVGAQRLAVYNFALAMWGSVLGSNGPVLVSASFAPLTCLPTSGVLGSAGPAWVELRGPNPIWYPGALANALNGVDGEAGLPEISSRFNSELGTPACLSSTGWYYGLDGNTPANRINFLNVVMHEIAHGLGVAGFLNKTSGALFDADGAGTAYGPLPDIYTSTARDNITSRLFTDPTETNADRATAMKTVGATVWNGANVNQQAALLLDGGYQENSLTVTAPAPLARDYGFFGASFGPAANAANFNGQWVAALDAAAPTSDGCTAITNAAAVLGKIALIERGTCGFVVKVKNAQDAGAIGVVIVNSAAGTWGPMGFTPGDPMAATITIPSVQVQRADGLAFIANAPITGGMVNGPITLAGMDVNGRTRLYSPWIVAGGSTFSHFDTALSPNALMEPFNTPQVQAQTSLDLTPAMLRDIGWPMNGGTTKMFNGYCDTGVPATSDGGFVTGGNIAGTDLVCKIGATRTSYYSCMSTYANKLLTDGLINSTQKSKILTCARRTADNWGR